LRRAIEARDRHCQHPSGCTVTAEHCHIDHIVPYAQGGLTTQDNGRCACPKHNLDRNNDPADHSPPWNDTS
jgi:5-methylcytosine-specific restriction endonuclease McrA